MGACHGVLREGGEGAEGVGGAGGVGEELAWLGGAWAVPVTLCHELDGPCACTGEGVRGVREVRGVMEVREVRGVREGGDTCTRRA